MMYIFRGPLIGALNKRRVLKSCGVTPGTRPTACVHYVTAGHPLWRSARLFLESHHIIDL